MRTRALFLQKHQSRSVIPSQRLERAWVLAVDATSQISSSDLSVIFAGILHEDHGFVPIVASMQVYYPYSHYFGP